MSQIFEARYRLTLQDYNALSDKYARLTKLRRIGLLANFVISALLFAAALYFLWAGDYWFGLYLLGLAILLLLLRVAVSPWARRRQFIHQRIGDYEISFSAGDEGFSTVSELSSGTVKWCAIRQVDDLSGHVLLWPNNRLGYIVPKRGFNTPAEAEAFARFAKDKTAGQKL